METEKNTLPSSGPAGPAEQPSAPADPRKKKKGKKSLVTPTKIIRWCMMALYAVAIYALTAPFITVTMYISEEGEITVDSSQAYSGKVTQEELDEASEKIRSAMNALQKNDTPPPEYHDTLGLSNASYSWEYRVRRDLNADELLDLISQARQLDKREFTEETVAKLNQATLRGQRLLGASVTISQSVFQMILGGSIGDSYGTTLSSISGSLMIYFLVLLPAAGFFVCLFDKRRHIKNLYAFLCSVICVVDTLLMIYPYVAVGAVCTILLYILLFGLSGAGMYAKQQEDYIVAHPEKEAEFTEKHPQFVKALINYKSASVPELLKKDREQASARHAQKHGRSRKK